MANTAVARPKPTWALSPGTLAPATWNPAVGAPENAATVERLVGAYSCAYPAERSVVTSRAPTGTSIVIGAPSVLFTELAD